MDPVENEVYTQDGQRITVDSEPEMSVFKQPTKRKRQMKLKVDSKDKRIKTVSSVSKQNKVFSDSDDDVSVDKSVPSTSNEVKTYKLEEVLNTKGSELKNFFLEETKQDISQSENLLVLIESVLEAKGAQKIHILSTILVFYITLPKSMLAQFLNPKMWKKVSNHPFKTIIKSMDYLGLNPDPWEIFLELTRALFENTTIKLENAQLRHITDLK